MKNINNGKHFSNSCKLVFLIFIFSNFILEAECTKEAQGKFKQDLDNGSFVLFTSIYKHFHELKKEDIWKNTNEFLAIYPKLTAYFDCTNNYIKSQAGSVNVPLKYSTFANDLNYIKKSFGGSFFIIRNSKIIDSSDIAAIEKNMKKTRNIYDTVLTDIKNESSQKKIQLGKKTKEEIFPGYKIFFESYNAVKKKNLELSAEDIRFIVSMEDLIEPDVPETIVNFLLRIETFKEVAITEKKKSWLGSSSLQRLIDNSQEIIDALQQLYPELKLITKIASSQNEPAVILLSESGGLFILLKQLLQEAQERLRYNKKG